MPTGEEQERLRRECGTLYGDTAEILLRHDPVGLNFGDNPDEYETEVATILPRLCACTSADDVQHVVHEEFCRWFDVETAGPIERYRAASAEIWRRWNERGGEGPIESS